MSLWAEEGSKDLLKEGRLELTSKDGRAWTVQGKHTASVPLLLEPNVWGITLPGFPRCKVWPLSSALPSLCLSILTWKIGMIIVSTSWGCCRDKTN